MVDYPPFIAKGFDIESGPTEVFCTTLAICLKGSGMKWDWPNTEAMMALVALDQSHLWDRYSELQRGLAEDRDRFGNLHSFQHTFWRNVPLSVIICEETSDTVWTISGANVYPFSSHGKGREQIPLPVDDFISP